MANITSLGAHEPSALPYLVSESLLAPDSKDYVWTVDTSFEDNVKGVEDELLATKHCVVWSRGGVVQRLFRFEDGEDEIVQAVLTRFPIKEPHQPSPSSPKRRQKRRPAKLENKKVRSSSPDKTKETKNEHSIGGGNSISLSEKAIVVALKTEAHIFLLSGTSYVVQLPFEVESILSAPRGVILQRKLPADVDLISPFLPPVPPNSFAYPQPRPQSKNTHMGRKSGSSFRSEIPFGIQPHSLGADTSANLPRAFSLTDPLAEMGVVVATSDKSTSRSTDDSDVVAIEALDSNEELLHISPLRLHVNAEKSSCILAVSFNSRAGTYTVWRAKYVTKTELPSQQKRIPSTSSVLSRRRSSHGFGAPSGADTPNWSRQKGFRESFGGASQYEPRKSMSASQAEKYETSEKDTFAAQLDPEQEFSKSSRRVSSLLARGDLSTGHEWSNFTDISVNNSFNGGTTATSRASFGGKIRHSFGSALGFGLRHSLPGQSPRSIGGNSFIDPVPDDELDDLNLEDNSDSSDLDRMISSDRMTGLHRELMLTKVKTFQSQRRQSFVSVGDNHDKPKAFVVECPETAASHSDDFRTFILGIMDSENHELIVTTLRAHLVSNTRPAHQIASSSSVQITTIEAVEIRKGTNILDACRINDGQISRLLVMSETSDGAREISLQAPWSPLFKLQLPLSLSSINPFGIPMMKSRASQINLFQYADVSELGMVSLRHATSRGRVDFVDRQGIHHQVQIELDARDPQVKRMMDVCRFVLPGPENAGEGLLIGLWNIQTWLKSRQDITSNNESTAFVILLFAMAVSFLPSKFSAVVHAKMTTSLQPSGLGTAFDRMLQEERSHGLPLHWLSSPAWDWTQDALAEITVSSKLPQNVYILQCALLAQEFLRSPKGQEAIGRDGYLPTSLARATESQRSALAKILIALHLLREEQKLDITAGATTGLGSLPFAAVLSQLGTWLGWKSWGRKPSSYYNLEDASIDDWLYDDCVIEGRIITIPSEPFTPPSILDFIDKCLNSQQLPQFPSLLDVAGRDRYHNVQEMARLTPDTISILQFLSRVRGMKFSPTSWTEAIAESGLNISMLEKLPEGVRAPFFEAIVGCQASPPISWAGDLLELVGRSDLRKLLEGDQMQNPPMRTPAIVTHEATRDFHTIGHAVLEPDQISPFDGSSEVDRQIITKLIFNQDRRFFEAVKLLHPMKPAIARCTPEPQWSDVEFLEAQKTLVQIVAYRTLSVSPGRGMLQFSTKNPLLTEKLPIPGFTLTCIVKPSNNTVTAERSIFTEEKVGWAFFHAGASTGLSISKDAKGIDTSWILFNKPPDLSNRHAGFLLALGLNGHLKNIAKWVAFKYLTPKHTMTSIGLLLGLSASYLGTMDSLITRLLSVHVTRMLPPGAAELNLSPLTQTTGIMGIGLLYCNSQHRRMSEIMLSEIENIDQDDSPTPLEMLRDECYRTAAGFSLGFINLGKGNDLQGLQDMHLVERLLALAITSKNVNLVHILDKATPAAIIAIALIFLKTNNSSVARRVDIPDTVHQFDYVRPDNFLLRTLTRHLIMWDEIEPTVEWFTRSLLLPYRHKASLEKVYTLNTEDLPFFNMVAGLCFSIGLRFAGSGRNDARDLLVHYLDQFIRICRLPAVNYDSKLTRLTVRNCQDLVALSAATVVAGTGDLHVLRRLRSLHGRIDPDTPYGSHLAAHLAIGALFLGGGQCTFGTSNLAVASLFCAFYPLFPTSVLDNKVHLQAFRHLWVLATESRCIVIRDIKTQRPVSVPISLQLKGGDNPRTINTPCLLPELDTISSLKINSPDYWEITLDFVRNPQHLLMFRKSQNVYVRRRAAYDNPHSSIFSRTVQALNDAQLSLAGPQALEWVLNLPAFSSLSLFEKALILPLAQTGMLSGINGTVIDARLLLESNAITAKGNRDAYLNIRILVDWARKVQREGGKLAWIGNEVIECIRGEMSND